MKLPVLILPGIIEAGKFPVLWCSPKCRRVGCTLDQHTSGQREGLEPFLRDAWTHDLRMNDRARKLGLLLPQASQLGDVFFVALDRYIPLLARHLE